MTQLQKLLESVKDHALNREQVEQYHSELTHLFSAVMLERADLKKKEALYFADKMRENPDESDARIKRQWRVTTDGLRLIELEAYKTILPKEISSLKNRIYALL